MPPLPVQLFAFFKMATKHILIVPGDGIGQEVTAAGKKYWIKLLQSSTTHLLYDEADWPYVAIEANRQPAAGMNRWKNAH